MAKKSQLPDFLEPLEDALHINTRLEEDLLTSTAATVLLVAVLWTLRVVLIRAVSRRSEILSPDQRRWAQNIRSLVWVLMILGLIMIWAPQLQTAAVALTAFVVAIVIATKEVILCIMGGFMRVSTAPFRMGDWINIEGITGEVVDINLFSAKVQELETAHGTYAYTGKIIQIPNSRYFTFNIENLSYLKQHKSHLFAVKFQSDTLDPAVLMKILREFVDLHTKDLQENAAQAWKRVKRASHIPLPDPAPQITMAANDFNNLHFIVRAYLPTKDAASIAARITHDFMSEVSKMKLKQKKEEEKWRHQQAAKS